MMAYNYGHTKWFLQTLINHLKHALLNLHMMQDGLWLCLIPKMLMVKDMLLATMAALNGGYGLSWQMLMMHSCGCIGYQFLEGPH